ncbi:MAG: tRNA (adenosine(37)-N6)-dimethylallyltransferase MiaA [Deltaproteobacteria bacterium]|nr:tRNA (adenosine(37)-N6)-dimethylallyltransferase MiaA [Deltaproteobacteria bacterium]
MQKVVLIVGPTAIGKSHLGLELALRFNGEIISADSVQVYKGLDIGSAKAVAKDLAQVPHHMIDIVAPNEGYSAADFALEARAIIEDISSRGKSVFIVGGTGLYIRALIGGLFECPGKDEAYRAELLERSKREGRLALHAELAIVDAKSAERIHPNNIHRLIRALEVYRITGRPMSEMHDEHAFSDDIFETLTIGLNKDRSVLYGGINARVDAMMEAGLLEEVEGLLDAGFGRELKSMQTLGYKEMAGYIAGELNLGEATELLKKNTRNFAKRQITWFGKDAAIKWFDVEDDSYHGKVSELVGEFLA